MGQDHPERTKKKGLSNQKEIQFDQFIRDLRLIERNLFIPELFAGSIDADIKKVERLIQFIPIHPLEVNMIDEINQRFYLEKRYIKEEITTVKQSPDINNKNNKKANKPKNMPQPVVIQKNEEQSPETYFQLETQQRFLSFLKKVQHWFYIQKQLNNGLAMKKSDKKVTVRKKILPNYQSQLDKHLYSKLYLKYYLIILKKNFSSKDKQVKNTMIQFHNGIGRMICQMIQNNHFTQKKLLQLAYTMIYLQKLSTKQKLKKMLQEIGQQFKPIYLTKEHSLALKPAQFDRVRQISRLYLDQLYLRSLKEAEDPEIIVDTNQGFGIVKNFPILRMSFMTRYGFNRSTPSGTGNLHYI